MPLQDWIHQLEEGGGAKFIKRLAAVLAFVVVAAAYDSLAYRGFSTQEAMENAQLARNVAQGKGYVTDSIHPLALYMLERQNPGSARRALNDGVPDLSHPPVYPIALAALIKVLPFEFTAKGRFYQPELGITIFNQVQLFVAVLLLFSITRRLFDARVAWLAAILFGGTELFWRFSVSGLSTTLLEVIFLAVVRAMLALEESGRANKLGACTGWAITVGALIAVGTMTRYSFGWVLLPTLAFCVAAARARWKTILVVSFSFLVVAAPWSIRNYILSGSAFGTNVYALVEQTPVFAGDQLERSLNPESRFKQMRLAYLKEKLLLNLQDIVGKEIPLVAGNWLSAFFLVGLLIPFRNPALGKLRLFLVGALAVWTVAEALGRTALSSDSPNLNSENMLVIVAPLLFAYGAGLFFILLDQLNLATGDLRAATVVLFTALLCLPLVLVALSPPEVPANSPYSPRWIQLTSRLISERELMMSDIPWAVSWYGQRRCVSLTLDDTDEFRRANTLKPVNALFLTQRTTDSALLPQLTGATNSWGRFFWDCWAHGEVPTGFPLQKAPVGFLPDQMLLSDRVRW